MKKIKLTQGKYAIVDDEDYPYLNRFKWHLSGDCLTVCRQFENYLNSKKLVSVTMRSLLVKYKQGHYIIFKDGNHLNHQKNNLIYVPFSTVQQKRIKTKTHNGSPTTSKYKGVSFDKSIKNSKYAWKMSITYQGKRYGKKCSSEEIAARLYNEKARELFGELAYQNNIKKEV